MSFQSCRTSQRVQNLYFIRKKQTQSTQESTTIQNNLNPNIKIFLPQLFQKQLKKDYQSISSIKNNYKIFDMKHQNILQIFKSFQCYKSMFAKKFSYFQKNSLKNEQIQQKQQKNFDQRTMAQTMHKKNIDLFMEHQQQYNQPRNFSFGIYKKSKYDSPSSQRTYIMDLQELIN